MAGVRSSYAYQKAAAELRARGLPCWICTRGIDYTLRWPHPWSFSADHPVELDAGGHVTDGLRAAHLRCNVQRGAQYGNAKRRGVLRRWPAPLPTPQPRSRNW